MFVYYLVICNLSILREMKEEAKSKYKYGFEFFFNVCFLIGYCYILCHYLDFDNEKMMKMMKVLVRRDLIAKL